MFRISQDLPIFTMAAALLLVTGGSLSGYAQVSCMITYSCATGSCGGFGTITKGPGQFASPQACQSAASANDAGMTATCSCTGGSAPGFAPVNRGPSLAEIRRMEQEQAAEEARRRYEAAVKVEQDSESKNLADRQAAAAAVESARQDFFHERDKLALLLRDAPAASLTVRDDSGSALPLRDDSTASPAAAAPQKLSKWGKEPPLPTSIGRALSSDVPTSVDASSASDYVARALGFIKDETLKSANSAARKSALSGEMFAETEMGPYGMTTVVMMNVATLPKFVFKQINGVVSGQVSPDEAMGMTVQAVNHIFNFSTPVNSAIENGASQTIQGQVTGQAKQSLATLAASFLPVEDEVKQDIASQSTHIADTALDAYKHIFTPSGEDQ